MYAYLEQLSLQGKAKKFGSFYKKGTFKETFEKVIKIILRLENVDKEFFVSLHIRTWVHPMKLIDSRQTKESTFSDTHRHRHKTSSYYISHMTPPVVWIIQTNGNYSEDWHGKGR